jgi:FKBP-type peptidyl-prolyl cis-trans isomerase
MKKSILNICLILLSLLALSSCKKDDDVSFEREKERQDLLIQEYIQKNNLTVEKFPSGLYKSVITPGSSRFPSRGLDVTVHYDGETLDGNRFDSSRNRGEPFTFSLGLGEVIAGWDEGLTSMSEGERSFLIIPSHLAYGTTGSGSAIPGNTILVFDVELLRF